MTLCRMDHLMQVAAREGSALAAFEAWSSASIKAVCEAAARCRRPIIIQGTPTEYAYMGGPEAMRHVVDWYVQHSGIDAALHLDHGTTLEQVEACVAAGFTSVMLDASRLPYEENIRLSAEAARIAHAGNCSIEAELGHVGGNEGGLPEVELAEDARLTRPEQAADFVSRTGVDCLAVAIGTVHGDYRGEPRLDLPRLEAIARAVELPLVLHGGSGTPPALLQQAIARRVAKINICTDIVKAWLRGVAAAEADPALSPGVPGPFFTPAHESLVAKASALIELFACRSSVVV
jgi:ketose-bisphosphate aldolase